MTTFSPVDARLIRMVAQWVADGETPSLLPGSLAGCLRAIAKDIDYLSERENGR